jgi:hypothetical protein
MTNLHSQSRVKRDNIDYYGVRRGVLPNFQEVTTIWHCPFCGHYSLKKHWHPREYNGWPCCPWCEGV